MKIGVFQLSSKLDFRENLKSLEELFEDIKAQGPELLFFPECFYSMGDGKTLTPHLVSQDNEHFRNIVAMVQKFQTPALGGSVAWREGGHVVNRALQLGPLGEVLSFYDKKHLFSFKGRADEGALYAPGQGELSLLLWKDWKIGINICFDVRFSPQAWHYRKLGANLLTYASAFTPTTGRAHWHTLLRARAIETQSYVVAAAQCGHHHGSLQSFGHSLVVDPWGEILFDGGPGPQAQVVSLDLAQVHRVRRQIPVFPLTKTNL